MKKLIISTLVASVFASSAAMADSYDDSNFVNVGVNGQYTMFSKVKTPGLAQSNVKARSAGYGANVGYAYAVDPSFRVGAELGYADLGKSKFSTVIDSGIKKSKKVKASQSVTPYIVKQKMFTALLTADCLVTPNWSVTGKVGPALVFQKTTGDATVATLKSHKVAPYVNLGTAYTLDNGLSVGVSYGHLFGSKSKSISDLANKKKVLSSNSVLLTVGYTFSF